MTRWNRRRRRGRRTTTECRRQDGAEARRDGPRAALAWLMLSLLTAFAAGTLAAETDFSGELGTGLQFHIPGARGYDATPLNPGNALGLTDLMVRSEVDLTIESRGESASADLWAAVRQYPVGDLFVGTAALAEGFAAGAGDDWSGFSGAVADVFLVAEPYIFTLDLMRAAVSWRPADTLEITAGRQSFLTGYGYGWNPVDLANPPKDPTDPGADVRGVDGLTLRWTGASWLDVKLYGALPNSAFAADYDEVLAGGEVTVIVPAVELKLAGLWGGGESAGDPYDLYPHAGAAAFFLDLYGVGVYGEGVLRSRSRRNLSDPAGGASVLDDELTFSALAGLEYYFAAGPSVALEYFYNGEGWNRGERIDFESALLAGAAGTGEYAALYTPTYFARHYILANLMIPWYAREVTVNLNLIVSPDSGALVLTPNAEVNLNYEGTLTAELWYSGQFSFDADRRDEAWFAPVRHAMWTSLRYYF